MSKADEPAFPSMGTYGIDGVTGPNYGLTRREYFAAKLFARFLDEVEYEIEGMLSEGQKYKMAAKRTIDAADALLRELERKPE